MKTQKNKFKQTEIGMIPEEWEVKSIGEVADVVGGGTPSTRNPEYWDGDIFWITPKDLSTFNLRYIKKGERNITKKGLENSSAKLLPKGAVLLTTRAPVGYLAIADNELTTNQGFRNLIPKNTISSEFLFYLLKKNVEILKSNAGGTTFGELSGSRLKELTFPIPPLPEQRAIAKILSDLDAKIELNREMNKTLEEIGRAIFKEWFINFNFPNEEGKPYKSSGGQMEYNEELGKEIPKGWRVGRLGFYIKRNRIKISSKDDWKDEKIIDLSVMPQFSISLESFQKGDAFDSNVFKLNEMDILFGSIRPYFGKAGFSPINGVVTGTIYSYLPRKGNFYSFILFLTTSRDFIDYTVRYSKGTKMPIIDWKDFTSYKFTLPSEEKIISEFNKLIINLIKKIKQNIQQSHTLSSIRDLLLPKLMSGKIRVPVSIGEEFNRRGTQRKKENHIE